MKTTLIKPAALEAAIARLELVPELQKARVAQLAKRANNAGLLSNGGLLDVQAALADKSQSALDALDVLQSFAR